MAKKIPIMNLETFKETDLLIQQRQKEPDRFAKIFYVFLADQVKLIQKSKLPATSLGWIVEHCDTNGFIRRTIAQYCRDIEVSRPTGQDHFDKMKDLNWIVEWPDENRFNYFLVNPRLCCKGSPKGRRNQIRQYDWVCSLYERPELQSQMPTE